MSEQPTDLDLVTDHPFKPSTWPDTCGHLLDQEWDGWMCGYTEAEHGDPEPTP